MARGLEYDDAVLKEVFNLILDNPLPRWEMEQLHVLNFWDFSHYVHHRKDWQILNPPDVCSDHPALLPPSSQVHDHLLTPTEKRRNRRKRAAQVAASASESSVSAPASAVYSNQPVSLPLLSQVPDHLLTPKKCKSRRKKTAQNTALGPEPVESAPASPEQVESAPASPESVESAPASPESVESAPASP